MKEVETGEPVRNEESAAVSAAFGPLLLSWNEKDNRREMPWKGEKDPYKIWLSEVILQQTRVEQGLKYYQNFIKTFPDIKALAAAPDEQVYKLWEGLGYYSRCRNLLAAARHIAGDLGGIFPSRYEDILQLKGVGSYTASAIASFAYGLPYAVLDGNVFRVLSRIADLAVPIDTTEGKKVFTKLAGETLIHEKAGAYNQAIMDFGAVVCKPVPDCPSCFFNRHCLAFREGKQLLLPVKEKKVLVKERWLNYFIPVYNGMTAIRQRTGRDIWQQLFEFPILETKSAQPLSGLEKGFEQLYGLSGYEVTDFQSGLRQKLTHQSICFTFTRAEFNTQPTLPGFTWVKLESLKEYAFPRTLKGYIDEI